MSDLTQRIAQLSTEQRIQLEERLLSARKTGHTERIPRRSDSGPAPLSFTQERLWFLAQLEPESAAYNEIQVYRITGPLNILALERSLDALAARHDSLRVCFREMDDRVMQVAGPLPPTHLNVVDLTATPADQQISAAWREIDSAGGVIFDLTHPPLWRVFLLRMGEDDHIFVRISHHIITDGWSGSIFWRELGHFYAAFVSDSQLVPLPELPISYADFSVWQRERLQGERLAGLVTYWRNRLAGLEPLNLPTDHPRPAQPSHRGALAHFQLDQGLSNSLSVLARASGASLYMLLLAAFQLLLHRYSGQGDIVVGSPIANRTRPELEQVYGFFANTLVLRADCGGNPSFRSLLAQVRKNALDAYQHQDLPFEKLVEELHPVRDMRRHPIVEVMFALQNAPQANVGLAGTTMQRLERTATTSKFDLSLFLYERSGGIEGRFEYATDLFDPSTIQRMIGHFQTLLAGIVADPDCPIANLPLLTAAERQRILVEWNQTAADYPADKTIHQLFAEQAARTPDAVAIIDGESWLTYRELDETTDRLAHYLLGLDVQPGEPIGIYLERSAEGILAMLAVLKAGAAYVPLDMASPPARLAKLFVEAGLRFVLTQSRHSTDLSTQKVETILLDTIHEKLACLSSAPLQVPVLADGMAYVMYTSGSTGVPKGVAVPHQAVVTLVYNTDYIQLTPADVIGCVSNPAFDASTFEVWGALLMGAAAVIIPKEDILTAWRLSQIIHRAGVTTLFVTTALFNHLIEEDATVFQSIDTLLFGGERVSARHVADCHTGGSPRRLLHVYGPTETTTFATWHPIVPAEVNAGSIPIGRPLANKQAYILNSHQQPVPIGIPGELYVGGAGLALGYLNRPDLTAERFIPHPFSDVPGARLYRTGDLARYREDGVIEFLGRVDRQVKIRGFRVEPGEIEAVLREYPAVREVVVGIVDDESGGKRLIAWWIARGETADAAALRGFLRQRLPDYMIPADFVHVDALPLNSNGKVDVARLPLPEGEHHLEPAHVPQTPLEQQLLAVWRQVLRKGNLGVDDNFFDAGGHSLLAVRLMSQVSQATGQELPVASLFYGPTIREQAALLEKKGWSPPWTSLVPVQPAGTRPPLFLVPPAASTSVRFAPLSKFLGPDQPVYGFDPVGIDGSQPHTTVEEIAEHFVEELRLLQPNGPYLLGGMCFGGHVVIEMARQLQAQSQFIPVIYIFDASPPANGPSWSYQPIHRNLAYYVRRSIDRWQQGNYLYALRGFMLGRLQRWLRNHNQPRSAEFEAVINANRIAQLSYRANFIESKIVLFQSAQYRRLQLSQSWSELSPYPIDIVHFPNTTHRSLLLEDENVERIAAKLREEVDRWIAEHWQNPGV
jgi:amino acid adenylation domain-containing protein